MDKEFLQTLQVAGQCLSEEVMEAILNQHNADLAAAAADPGVSGGSGGRTFSQDEVNRIVSERLARQRLRPADDQREAQLQQREHQLTCREYLLQKQYPGKLLELLDTSDPERFKAAADEMAASFPGICANQTPPPYRPGTGTRQWSGEDALSNAFKIKH